MSVTAGNIFAITEESESSLPKSESDTEKSGVESRNEEKKVPDEAGYPKLFPYAIK